MKKYTAVKGDRLTRIADRNQVSTQSIIDANPQIFTADRKKKTDALIASGDMDIGEFLIYPGEILTIPDSETKAIIDELVEKASSEDELRLFIDGKKVPLPHEFEFTEYFISCSDSFSCMYPFDARVEKPIFKIDPKDFKEKGLPPVKIYIGDEKVLTGEVEIPAFRVTVNSVSQTLGGRSKTYLLEKSEILPSIQKEFIQMTFDKIVDTVAKGFGLSSSVQSGVTIGAPFAKAAVNDGETPFSFLTRLARERACLIGKDGNGNVLIMKAVESEPVASFTITPEFLAFLGVDSLDFAFDTTKIFGSYIGKATGPNDANITETVESNVLMQRSIKIINFEDGTAGNIGTMTAWEEQRSVREFAPNSIPFPSWLNPNTGKRWKAGQFITLKCPDAMIIQDQIMMIDSIKFTESNGRRVAELSIVPEETYIEKSGNKNTKKKADNETVIDKIGNR
jgi:prophage tail gpP-like protein